MDHIRIRLSMQGCSPFCNKFHQLYLWGPENLNTFYVLRKKQCLQLFYEWKSKLKTSAFCNLRSCGLVITTEAAIFWKPGTLLSDYKASHLKKPPNLRHWKLYKFSNRTFIFCVTVPKLSAATVAMTAVQSFLSLDCLKLIHYSYFHSILTYGIIFWGNTHYSNVIFKMQKRIIRIMVGDRKSVV